MDQIFTFFSLSTYLLMGKGALWFLIGYCGYFSLVKRGFNMSFINSLYFLDLFMLFYLIYIILNVLFILAGFMISPIVEFLDLNLNNYDFMKCSMAEENTTATPDSNSVKDTTPTPDSESVKVAKLTADASNYRTGAVVTTATLALGAKVANSMPTPLGKAAVVAGSGILGLGLAGATKVISTIDATKKSQLLGDSLNGININAILGISSNNGEALLQYVQLFQDIGLLFFIAFVYYSFFYFADIERLKVLFSINGWNRLNRIISKGLMYNKKISFVISFCSLILMGTSLISARYFLSFYLSNLSYIIETYFK